MDHNFNQLKKHDLINFQNEFDPLTHAYFYPAPIRKETISMNNATLLKRRNQMRINTISRHMI